MVVILSCSILSTLFWGWYIGYLVFGIVDNILGFGLDPSFPFPSLRVCFPSPPARTAPERKEEGENFEESLVNHCWDHLHY